MVKELFKNLYRIEIPLPKNPLKFVNSYVIKSSERNLIIDTGWNQKECIDAMQSGLGELGVDLKKTDFFITHYHIDHFGLISHIALNTSKIYFNQPDASWIRSGTFWDESIQFARLNGFPEEELEAVLQSHPGFKFRSGFKIKPEDPLTFHILKEGDGIRVGDYDFKCVETPGHTKGHMCLYESGKKIFIAGDHLLKDITPTISLWSNEWDPLKEYLASLDKVYLMDIEFVLPGHGAMFTNCKERIEELKHHHQERINEITTILGKGDKNAFQIASEMTWDILYDSWDLFPVTQKWFATGEAISHLKYLEGKERVRREMHQKKIIYSINEAPKTKK